MDAGPQVQYLAMFSHGMLLTCRIQGCQVLLLSVQMSLALSLSWTTHAFMTILAPHSTPPPSTPILIRNEHDYTGLEQVITEEPDRETAMVALLMTAAILREPATSSTHGP